jgi:hypothetical protein
MLNVLFFLHTSVTFACMCVCNLLLCFEKHCLGILQQINKNERDGEFEKNLIEVGNVNIIHSTVCFKNLCVSGCFSLQSINK